MKMICLFRRPPRTLWCFVLLQVPSLWHVAFNFAEAAARAALRHGRRPKSGERTLIAALVASRGNPLWSVVWCACGDSGTGCGIAAELGQSASGPATSVSLACFWDQIRRCFLDRELWRQSSGRSSGRKSLRRTPRRCFRSRALSSRPPSPVDLIRVRLSWARLYPGGHAQDAPTLSEHRLDSSPPLVSPAAAHPALPCRPSDFACSAAIAERAPEKPKRPSSSARNPLPGGALAKPTGLHGSHRGRKV